MKGTTLYLLVLVLIFACGPKPSRQELRVGINGEAVYVLNNDGSVNGMFKREYSVHDYTVLIQRDTVKLGEDFYSLIMVASPSHSIKITSPEVKDLPIKENNGSTHYTYQPKKAGVYEYTGIIEFDSVIARFSYRFIVVDSNN